MRRLVLGIRTRRAAVEAHAVAGTAGRRNVARLVAAAALSLAGVAGAGLVAAPASAGGSLKHAGIVVINRIPTSSSWYQPSRKAVARLDYLVKNYSFKYARACPAATYKCIHLELRHLSNLGTAAQTYPLSPVPHQSWQIQVNASNTGKFKADQKFKVLVHELGHTFDLAHRPTWHHNFMYPYVKPSGYFQRFSDGQRRYLRYYRHDHL
jgi:hypothetical protein